MYGNWIGLVANWRLRNQHLHEDNKARVINQRDYLRNQVEEIKTAMERLRELESVMPLETEDGGGEKSPPGVVAGTEIQKTGSAEDTSRSTEEEGTRNNNVQRGNEDQGNLDLLRKAVSEMSVEELQEIVNTKKRGRPKNKEKELKQRSKEELRRKASRGEDSRSQQPN